ncbi:MAG: hypothetical protein A2057_15200 [Ignavibacteria bacterium GWA2_35_9]|nr:MAG: hypothetical protein A2057_15200 [Ignavibacteria bacterium GWA2_35_9]OGU47112.1 MAG: hypothetical protein A2000_07020 [Ignavibacteria bacterium GWB2_36_8]OGU48868.1 MAG: hypothetical protein A2080_03400 [Ignavibacteria bacterium GWC2_36_12]
MKEALEDFIVVSDMGDKRFVSIIKRLTNHISFIKKPRNRSRGFKIAELIMVSLVFTSSELIF